MKNKAIFKFNNGRLALLCSNCKTIIKIGKDFSKEELKACSKSDYYLSPQYCNECKKNQNTL